MVILYQTAEISDVHILQLLQGGFGGEEPVTRCLICATPSLSVL